MYRIQVVRNFSDTDAFVHGKKNQLKKAFFNLLKNAFESIGGEGVIQVTHCAKDDMVTFEKHLLAEAVNAKEKIETILTIGNIDFQCVQTGPDVVDDLEHEMISFAKAEGVARAKYSLTLAFKLEWVRQSASVVGLPVQI